MNGIPHRLVFPASLPTYDSAKLDSNIEKICPYEMTLFGSSPFTTYTALFRWRPDVPFGGGIERSGGRLMNSKCQSKHTVDRLIRSQRDFTT